MGCNAILILQRLNLNFKGYIILRGERIETIIHFRKNMMAQPLFYH